MWLDFIQDVYAQFAYLGLAGMLLAAGLGVPIPEDIPLLFGGLASANGFTNPYVVFGVAYVSILAGDMIIFSTGRRLGPVALARPWAARVLTPSRQQMLNAHFARHGFLTIVVARHMAGLRAPCFLMAGVAGMSRAKFLLADAMGACISVPLFIWLGYKFGENLPELLEKLGEYQKAAAVGLVVLVVAAVALRRWLKVRRTRAQKAAAAQAEEAALQPLPSASGAHPRLVAPAPTPNGTMVASAVQPTVKGQS